jgi:hypothetical protein
MSFALAGTNVGGASEAELKNINDVDINSIVDVGSFSDLPLDLDELHIPNEKGEIIFVIKGRDQIKEFFNDQEEMKENVRKTLLKERLDNMIKNKQCERRHGREARKAI